MAAYGVDVLDPRVTPRRLAVLVDRLPPWARRGGEAWSTEAELLAMLVDRVAELTWVTARLGGAKSARQPRPIPRPPDPARMASMARLGPPRAGLAPGAPGEPEGPGGWDRAARELALIPGVVVNHG
jgi:hypothetical protein